MGEVAPFEPRRFRTTVEHYVRGRLAYPRQLIDRIIELTALKREDAVLDLGCGPGLLAAAFAPRVRRVVGMDPEPAMLAAAVSYAREKDVSVEFRLGSSYDLNGLSERFYLVTMGRSFQWMDRAATLRTLDRIIEPGGAVALLGDEHLRLAENRWCEEYEAILAEYGRADATHFRNTLRDGSRHEAYLLDSSFNRLERVSVIRKLQTPVERLIDRALSRSNTSPERLGHDLDAAMGKVRDTLARHAVNGMMAEVVEFQALLAFRA
jgi:ubiquinone/menaquinone biosynthesis C-methylase UbiE